MTRTIYATHASCDHCGAVETLAAPTRAAPGGQQQPAGWLPSTITIRDMYGNNVLADLCAKCMALPLTDLIAPLEGAGP